MLGVAPTTSTRVLAEIAIGAARARAHRRAVSQPGQAQSTIGGVTEPNARTAATSAEPQRGSWRTALEDVLAAVVPAAHTVFGEGLWSVVLFGSAARGTPRPDSNIDLLIVADGLPRGRVARSAVFANVERAVAEQLTAAGAYGCTWTLSGVFKTPEEAAAGSPLFLNMTEDARLLYDRDAFFAGVLERLRARLAGLGSRRIWRDTESYWDLKPDYKPGEVFEI